MIHLDEGIRFQYGSPSKSTTDVPAVCEAEWSNKCQSNFVLPVPWLRICSSVSQRTSRTTGEKSGNPENFSIELPRRTFDESALRIMKLSLIPQVHIGAQ